MEGISPSVDGFPLAQIQNAIEIFDALAQAPAGNSREAAFEALETEGISACDLPGELYNDVREMLSIALKKLAHSHFNAVRGKYRTTFVPIVVEIYRVDCSGKNYITGDPAQGT